MGARGALKTDGGASAAPSEVRVAIAAAVVAAAGVAAAVEAAVAKFPRLPRPWPVATALAEDEVEVKALGRGRLAWAGRCVLSSIELFLSLFPPGST